MWLSVPQHEVERTFRITSFSSGTGSGTVRNSKPGAATALRTAFMHGPLQNRTGARRLARWQYTKHDCGVPDCRRAGQGVSLEGRERLLSGLCCDRLFHGMAAARAEEFDADGHHGDEDDRGNDDMEIV